VRNIVYESSIANIEFVFVDNRIANINVIIEDGISIPPIDFDNKDFLANWIKHISVQLLQLMKNPPMAAIVVEDNLITRIAEDMPSMLCKKCGIVLEKEKPCCHNSPHMEFFKCPKCGLRHYIKNKRLLEERQKALLEKQNARLLKNHKQRDEPFF